MRTIRFRAVVIDNDRKNRLEYNVWPISDERCFVENGGFYMWYSWIEQFTGFRDASGKRIYEGDILKSSWGENYLVIWEGSGWKIKSCKSKSKPAALRGFTAKRQVIGNKFQNPELL